METINENTISFINIFNELCANGVIDSQLPHLLMQ